MNTMHKLWNLLAGALKSVFVIAVFSTTAIAAGKPNILVIMTDDVGIWNISAYHRGMMELDHSANYSIRWKRA